MKLPFKRTLCLIIALAAAIGMIVFAPTASAETTKAKNSFTDVEKSDYFRTAVLWAVENGVTAGTGKKTFSPDATCTRAQVVTFLYRSSDME